MRRTLCLFTSIAFLCAAGTSNPAVAQTPNVRAWGWNASGQLGNGVDEETVSRSTPVQINGLTGVTAVAGSMYHSLAIGGGGAVWAWGANGYGELGNGNNANSDVPVQVTGLTAAVAVAAGIYHSLALKSDGTVWAWGSGGEGGSSQTSNVPVQVTGLSGVTAIAGGELHSLALTSGGMVWAWGANNSGQLGNGGQPDYSAPVQVSGLTGVVAIAAGDFHSLALKSDGTVWAWGYNTDGELGNGSNTNSNVPVQVSIAGVSAIAGGGSHNLALKTDGTLWAWGYNSLGELGIGTFTSSNLPVAVTGLSGVKSIAAGGYNSLAQTSDGVLWDWGANLDSELGNGTTQQNNVPVQVNGIGPVAAFAGGVFYNLAAKSDGTAWSWGFNVDGELGNGVMANSNVPVVVSGVDSVVAVATGVYHSLALKSDGTVWAWGANYDGELGNATTAIASDVPVQVTLLTGAVSIAAGAYHSLAAKSDGTVWAWGYDNDGELGDGSATVNSTAPVPVVGLTNAVSVAAGDSFSLALKADGTVWTWGANDSGQLGNNSTAGSTVPVQVASLAGIVAVAAAGSHAVALRSDGTVWAWGYNNDGELGNSSYANSGVPVQVTGLTGVVAIACAEYGSVALSANGTVWAWGVNGAGELGNGSPAVNSNVPVQVSGVTGAVAIAADLALKSDGTIWAWGSNFEGQLGDGTNAYTTVPVPVSNLQGVAAIAGGGLQSLAALAGSLPQLSLKPSSLYFAANSGARQAATVSLTNSGAAPVTIGNIVLTGMNPGDFTLSNTCSGTSLAPSQSCNLNVAFAPLAQGPRYAALLIAANAPGSPILVPLSGGAASGCSYSVSPTTLAAPSSGAVSAIAIQTDPTCSWSITGLPTWITASATSGTGTASLTLTIAANTGAPLSASIGVAGTTVTVTEASSVLLVNSGGVVNAASYTAPVAPGSIAAIFGNFLLAAPLTVSTFPIPLSLGGLGFGFGGPPSVPLFYANTGQVDAQIPWELSGQVQATMTATLGGQTSTQTITLAEYAPGIFTMNGEGTGQGAILGANNRVADSSNPATAGTTILQIFCTGLGPVSNQPATGAAAPTDPNSLAETITQPAVTVGGATAQVLYSGLAPGSVGLYQVNAKVSASSATGPAVPVAISIGGAASNTVTIAVQ